MSDTQDNIFVTRFTPQELGLMAGCQWHRKNSIPGFPGYRLYVVVDTLLSRINHIRSGVGDDVSLNESLDHDQLVLVSNCHEYWRNDPGGLPGHQIVIVVAKLWQELIQIDEDLDIEFAETTIEPISGDLDERDLKLVNNSLLYASGKSGGMLGHNLMLIISKLWGRITPRRMLGAATAVREHTDQLLGPLVRLGLITQTDEGYFTDNPEIKTLLYHHKAVLESITTIQELLPFKDA